MPPRTSYPPSPPSPSAARSIAGKMGCTADLRVRRNGKLCVFVTDGGKARFVMLPDAQEGRPVLAAIATDKPVIVDGCFSLKDGDEITAQ